MWKKIWKKETTLWLYELENLSGNSVFRTSMFFKTSSQWWRMAEGTSWCGPAAPEKKRKDLQDDIRATYEAQLQVGRVHLLFLSTLTDCHSHEDKITFEVKFFQKSSYFQTFILFFFFATVETILGILFPLVHWQSEKSHYSS